MKPYSFYPYMPALLLALVICLTGCRTSRKVESPVKAETTRYLSSKVKLTVPTKDAVFTVNGTLKLIGGDRMQVSFLMPIIRTEVARMEVTPDTILLVDRMGKRYVEASRDELKDMLPKNADFAHLEEMLFKAAEPNGKKVLSGDELGIPSLEKGRVELSDFSYDAFTLTPTELSSKYTRVELREILGMLLSL